MTIEVYKEPTVEKDMPLLLRLVSDGNSGVTLIAVDKAGEKLSFGNVLYINKDGTFGRSINMKIEGLQTNKSGQIVEVEE